jgi:hypothetical protein
MTTEPHKDPSSLGSLMTARRSIDEGQLAEALAEARRRGVKVGQVLVEMGAIAEEVRDLFLDDQLAEREDDPKKKAEIAIGMAQAAVAHGDNTLAELKRGGT